MRKFVGFSQILFFSLFISSVSFAKVPVVSATSESFVFSDAIVIGNGRLAVAQVNNAFEIAIVDLKTFSTKTLIKDVPTEWHYFKIYKINEDQFYVSDEGNSSTDEYIFDLNGKVLFHTNERVKIIGDFLTSDGRWIQANQYWDTLQKKWIPYNAVSYPVVELPDGSFLGFKEDSDGWTILVKLIHLKSDLSLDREGKFVKLPVITSEVPRIEGPYTALPDGTILMNLTFSSDVLYEAVNLNFDGDLTRYLYYGEKAYGSYPDVPDAKFDPIWGGFVNSIPLENGQKLGSDSIGVLRIFSPDGALEQTVQVDPQPEKFTYVPPKIFRSEDGQYLISCTGGYMSVINPGSLQVLAHLEVPNDGYYGQYCPWDVPLFDGEFYGSPRLSYLGDGLFRLVSWKKIFSWKVP